VQAGGYFTDCFGRFLHLLLGALAYFRTFLGANCSSDESNNRAALHSKALETVLTDGRLSCRSCGIDLPWHEHTSRRRGTSVASLTIAALGGPSLGLDNNPDLY